MKPIIDTAGPVKIIQVSDSHLMEDPAERYRGIDVEKQFGDVLTHILRHHGDASLLILTGDICHQSSAAAYQRVIARLDETGIPWRWIPGNHDDPQMMAALAGREEYRFRLAGWQLTLLDSTSEADGCGSGSLAPEQLQRLEESLRVDGPQLVVVHHNPISVGSRWQDAISMGNADHFCRLLQQSGQGGVVIFGHIHQARDMGLGSAWRLLSCPSTAVQFRKGADEFVIETDGEEALPGYRWLRFSDRSQLETGIERCSLA